MVSENYTIEGKKLSQYFDWMQAIINFRIQNMEDIDFMEMVQNIPLPVEKPGKQSVYTTLIKEYQLNEAEQFILLLSLAPYFVPEIINSFSEIPLPSGQNIDMSFNKSLVNKSVYPTIETAISLLGGNNVEYRHKYFNLFTIHATLFKEDIIAKPEPPHGEPFTRSTLSPGQNFLNNIISGENRGPEFSHDFPAIATSPELSWDDLVLDYDTRKQLEEVKEWIDYEDMCKRLEIQVDIFKAGYKCLFYGPPGTGKTLAASLIGKLTNRKVYKIDLSAVVSKYIGETEKNLAKIFDRAAHGNWILFFDEADSLFGKRGATQNAHDRYANQEVSYLLQRFESYEGVSILASNFKENIDNAFYRRFHSIVNFKRPEADERYKLWQVHLPKQFTFEEEIDLHDISRSVKITGAGIYNVMRRSCMKAALNGDMIVRGKDMLESVKMEFSKENKLI